MSYQRESRVRSQKLVALNSLLDKFKDDLTIEFDIDTKKPWLVHLLESLKYELTKELLENDRNETSR